MKTKLKMTPPKAAQNPRPVTLQDVVNAMEGHDAPHRLAAVICAQP